MARYQKATSFTAGRPVTLEGVAYQPGDTIPVEVVKGVKRLSALISAGYIVPDPDIWHRRSFKRSWRQVADWGHATLRRSL